MILCVTLHQTTTRGFTFCQPSSSGLREILAVSTSLATFWEIPSHMMNWLRFNFFFTIFSSVTLLEVCGVKLSRVDWGYALRWVLQSSLHTWFWHSVCAGSGLYNLERTLARVSPFTLNVPPVSSGDSIETLSHKCIFQERRGRNC